MCRKLLLLKLFILFISGAISAQNNPYRFSHLHISNGLSNNQVTAILKDKRGFMWFGTLSGLNRYDGYDFKIFKHDLRNPASINDDFIVSIFNGPDQKLWVQTRKSFNIYDPVTETFDRKPEVYLNQIGIPGAALTDIKTDENGVFWFLHPSRGLYKYKPKTAKALLLTHQQDDSISAEKITAIANDGKGSLWLIHEDGLLKKLDIRTNKVTKRVNPFPKSSRSSAYKLFVDKDGDLWFFVPGFQYGLFYYCPDKQLFRHITTDSGKVRLNNNLVNNVIQDKKGLIWIGTDHGGVNLLDKKDFLIRYLVNNETDDKSLAQNSITALYQDDADIIWLGTFKRGLSYYHKNIIRFPLYKHLPSDKNSLPYDDVNRFVEDAAGNLWIGTNGGGLIYFNRKTGHYTRYMHTADPNSISNDVVVSLCLDHTGKLWIGTYFGGLDCFDGEKFIHYRHDEKNPESLADDRVWEIKEDSQNRLWVGTLAGGLDLFDRKTGVFHHYKPGGTNSIHSTYIADIMEDHRKNLWFGTADGIDVLEHKTGRFLNYAHAENDPGSLSNNNVITIFQDSRKLVWVGTREGLDVYNADRKKLRSLRKEDGLPDNAVLTILEDRDQNLWLSTPNGLSNLMIRANGKSGYEIRFKNYDESDGLQGREFNENAAWKTRSGELIFGGGNGFNLFNPESMITNHQAPGVVLTDFQLFNKSIAVNEKIGKRTILEQSITESKEIILPYNENVFSIAFASLDFTKPAKTKYRYKLTGFDKGWLYADTKLRKATYTNLDPGDYVFHVNAANEEGIWNKTGKTLNIKILPPFWKTAWAYLAYFILVAGTLYLFRRRGIQKLQTEFALRQERQQARQMHELDMMKIKFFTNISHEFRTPLSLILAPTDKLLKQADNPDNIQQFHLIQRNARRLLHLVNQLLDFRKMEVKELRLHDTEGDIAVFLKEICYSFTDVAEKKNIAFSYNSIIDNLETRFDHDKMERILFNLLSNAFKFTAQDGAISVDVNLLRSGNDVKSELEILVKDNGIGMESDKQERIFERFFQNEVPGFMVNQGSGIGLAITKEFVSLHGGHISVQSEAGKGSCFRVIIPVSTVAVSARPVMQNEILVLQKDNETLSLGREQSRHDKKPALLLVEDNDDFRFYLKDNLKQFYHIMEAGNGKEGWQKTLFLHPDLVVSDINMPEMNGMELCRKIKQDNRTLHVPVILLTAFAGEEQQLKGLETGANDYMAKPFNFEILHSKIRNLLQQQEFSRKTYRKQIEVNHSATVIESQDEKFMQQMIRVISKNMSNPDFTVEELSREMNMSRVALYKKILGITGKTPIEYIKSVRLNHAAKLLEKSQLTIAEIAYEVGFNNPKYFSKSFKIEFGVLPSAYLKKEKDA